MNFTEKDLLDAVNLHRVKLSKIKCVVFDCDGILTNGHVTYEGEEMGWNRTSHTSDGYGMQILMQAGLKVGVISGGNSKGVLKRYKDNLKLDFVYLGNEDKRQAYKKILKMGFNDDEVLYMADELFDMPLLKRCGFAVTVPIASQEVKAVCDYVTIRESGMGCARELIDILRNAQNLTVNVPEF
ncbi:MAG: HAD hydrolase family protein [Bacteriovoracaceae bacterium]|jgi:3-deoxy-D-manno-octulosonate 8-phosphate phosphatase (KDO 8-P phosphatase)|nr:HAD hydrolase family protein [Bacteriovoracaceae bacterium]